MSKKKTSKLTNGWDRAIDDARNHILRLRTAVAVFEEMKAAGKPWPSKLAKRQVREQQRSA
jgi:hypothetical protein